MIKKLSFLFLIALPLFATTQVRTVGKAKMGVLQLPPYDVFSVDVNQLMVEYAFTDMEYHGVKTFRYPGSGNTVCSFGSENAHQPKPYGVNVFIKAPSLVLLAKDDQGQFVTGLHLNHSSDTLTVEWKGENECSYQEVDKALKGYRKDSLEKHKEALELFVSKKGDYDILDITKNTALYIQTAPYEFLLYGGTNEMGRNNQNYDYSDLDGINERATQIFERLAEKVTKEDQDALTGIIEEWKKVLTQLDRGNKKARINANIASGIHWNIAHAYLALYDLEKAFSHSLAAKSLIGETAFKLNYEKDIQDMERISIGLKANEQNLDRVDEIYAIAEQQRKVGARIQPLEPSKYKDLLSKVERGISEQHKKAEGIAVTYHQAAIDNGIVNKYELMVDFGFQGNDLTIREDMKTIPDEVFELQQINTLTIQNAGLEEVSPRISELYNLKRLELGNNNLTTLPKEIGQLTELKKLDLGKNPLSSIPDEIQHCKNLNKLIVKKTELSKKAIQQLESLLPDCKIKD